MLTWKDHQERPEIPMEMAYQKCLSKSAIGPITLDFYAAFAYVAQLQASGVDTQLSLEDVRQLMTDALEGAFDLKHGDTANPMAHHALLLGMKTFDQVKDTLDAQGLDLEKIERLAAVLGGRSVRDLAGDNQAFAIAHGNTWYNAVQRFINSAPEVRPMDFIAALLAARVRPSSVAYEILRVTAEKAGNLAAVYRDTLFPAL